MRYIYVLLLLVVMACGIARAQDEPHRHLSLYGHLNPVDTAGPHSALWGYTAPDGREYALFGSQIGTFIIDITEQPIRQVGFVRGPRSAWRELKVYQHYAYVVTESRSVDDGAGLQIIDLAHLPASAELIRTDTSEFISAHTVYVRDHYLYVMGTAPEAGANRGVIILDLAPDPLHPHRVGVIDPYYFHDCFVRNDTLLASAVYGQGLDIYDVRDKSHPVHLTTVTYPYSGTHNAELTADGHYAVTTDEVGFTPKTLKVWDISDLQNVSKVADYSNAPGDVVHNVHISGRYAYVSWYTAGVRVIDMIDPTHPREVAYYDTYPGESGGFNGVWEVFPFFPSGRIIASDRQTGLWVFTFDSTVAGSLSGVVYDSLSGRPLAGVDIYVPEQDRHIATDFSGHYYVGGVDGDSATMVLSRFGYGGITRRTVLHGDVKSDVRMSPLRFGELVVRAHDGGGVALGNFSAAVEPYLHSEKSDQGAVRFGLPLDSTYTITVGRWGNDVVVRQVSFRDDGQVLDVELDRRYADNSTLDLGWSLDAPGDNAVTGRWVRIVPYLGYIASGWVHPAAGPSGAPYDYTFMTGEPPIDQPPQNNDVNGGRTTLTTPLMDLTDHRNPVIRFDRWFVQYERDTVLDSFVVDLSNDAGATWHQAYWETKGKGGWDSVTFRPAEVVPLTDRMQMRVRISDTLGDALMFAAVDNFEVRRDSLIIAADTSGPTDPPIDTEPVPGPESLQLSVVYTSTTRSPDVVVDVPQGDRVRLELFNALGQRLAVLHEGAIATTQLRIQLPDLISGWYVVRALSSSGEERESKVVVTR